MAEDDKWVPFSILQPEIVADILSRLAVNDVGRSMCVSKSWRRLISGPDFVKQHLARSISDQRCGILTAFSGRRYRTISTRSLLVENKARIIGCVDLSNDWENSTLVGSCHGLVCIVKKEHELILLNPVTKRSRTLPDSGIWKRVSGKSEIEFKHGFGYDVANDDYKMVIMMRDYASNYPEDIEVEVYSMRNDSWKRIGDFPHYPNRGSALCISGRIVWFCTTTPPSEPPRFHNSHPLVDLCEWKILALDLATETYIEVPLPVVKSCDVLIGELDGCLCMFEQTRKSHLDVWIMKELGVQESWTNVARIPYHLNHVWWYHLPFYMPLWLSKDGEMIIWQRKKLIIYNMRNGAFRHPQMTARSLSHQAVVYAESLISFEIKDNDRPEHTYKP